MKKRKPLVSSKTTIEQAIAKALIEYRQRGLIYKDTYSEWGFQYYNAVSTKAIETRTSEILGREIDYQGKNWKKFCEIGKTLAMTKLDKVLS